MEEENEELVEQFRKILEELETLFRTVQGYDDTLSKVNGAEVTEAEKNTLKRNRDIILRKIGMF